ncbi:type A chloramphenicol O-acetyltransferase [Morganella morganii]|uniref:Chloramphenicol acetyltransferase n=1 Tax=Morganella morganii TaxID=582 RepID=A0A433ZSU7_MORMO|nr:type A chloramphenicol O-acetyltransferase [Morganella morganii]RUT65193.1 type A chloramphenicol O-acetyltransferase [Morganella morganii]
MNFTRIDLTARNRREHFALYRQQIKCGFSLTTKLDITALRTALAETDYKFYPVMIYLISRIVNQFPEFRMAMKDNELIYWDQSDPVFTVFHKETETFSALSCRYCPDLSEFMAGYNTVMAEYQHDTALFPQENLPENHLNISSLPWVSFDGFNLNITGNDDYFAPVFAMAKFQQEYDRVLLPVSVQVHHAVCDGFHAARFINTLQLMCDNILN